MSPARLRSDSVAMLLSLSMMHRRGVMHDMATPTPAESTPAESIPGPDLTASPRIKITGREHVVVYGEGDKAPFWIEHFLGLLLLAVGILVVGTVVLSLTDVGRAIGAGIGLLVGLALACWLFTGVWRRIRSGAPAVVWVGEMLSAVGWSCMAIALAAGIPFVFWLGTDTAPVWAFPVVGASAVVFTIIAVVGIFLQTRGPLPALDRTPRSARVLLNEDDSGDGGQTITVRYLGVDGEEHDADLADLIHPSSRDRFSLGSTWQVYAFRDAGFADAVVFLTEQHDDVWRHGFKLNGVRLGGESGPITPGPGSPFLRDNGKWSFED